MKRFEQLMLVLGMLFVFSSCKSLKKLSSKDNSNSSNTSISAKKTARKDVKFIKDISVTPGNTAAATKHTSAKTIKNSKPLSTEGKGLKAPEGFNIESADWLQFKYAIITDATVEKLSNLELLKVIDFWYGTRYCIGGSTANCIDCSAFTQNVLRDAYKIDIPRTAQEQFDATDKIDITELQEGDLVFFYTGGRAISHVGVYLLNNKFVHAATSGGVMVSDLNDAYWQSRFRGAGRPKNSTVSATPQ